MALLGLCHLSGLLLSLVKSGLMGLTLFNYIINRQYLKSYLAHSRGLIIAEFYYNYEQLVPFPKQEFKSVGRVFA